MWCININRCASFFRSLEWKAKRNSLGIVLSCFVTACGGTAMREYSRAVINDVPVLPEKKARVVISNNTSIYLYLSNTRIVEIEHRAFFIPYQDNNLPIIDSVYYETRNLDEYIRNPDYFVVEVLVDSDTKSVTLKPSEICLQLDTQSSNRICPTDWIPLGGPWFEKSEIIKVAPQERWAYQKYFYTMCSNAFSARNTRFENNRVVPIYQPFVKLSESETIKVSPDKPGCISLKYSIAPPNPRISFELVLGPIHVNGQLVEPPKIQYILGVSRHVWH